MTSGRSWATFGRILFWRHTTMKIYTKMMIGVLAFALAGVFAAVAQETGCAKPAAACPAKAAACDKKPAKSCDAGKCKKCACSDANAKDCRCAKKKKAK